ncbi:MAG TPA: hypothetical protein VFZ08_17065 [Terriglobia bacterium]|nr:hypothetical protein [Terriglobia bacterium]
MSLGVLISLAIFAGVALLVALVDVAKIHDLEEEARNKLYSEEREHQQMMRELDGKLAQLRKTADR